jgi:hypothetical protein
MFIRNRTFNRGGLLFQMRVGRDEDRTQCHGPEVWSTELFVKQTHRAAAVKTQ